MDVLALPFAGDGKERLSDLGFISLYRRTVSWTSCLTKFMFLLTVLLPILVELVVLRSGVQFPGSETCDALFVEWFLRAVSVSTDAHVRKGMGERLKFFIAVSVSTDALARRGTGERSASISFAAALAKIMEVLRLSEDDPALLGVPIAPVKESDLSISECTLWRLLPGLGVD